MPIIKHAFIVLLVNFLIASNVRLLFTRKSVVNICNHGTAKKGRSISFV